MIANVKKRPSLAALFNEPLAFDATLERVP